MATKITTLNQLIDTFKSFTNDHLILQDFGYGPTSEIGRSIQMKFPYLWITHSSSSIISIQNKTQIPSINFTFIIVDQINDQANYMDTNGNESTNVQEILSDCLQIVQDLIGFTLSIPTIKLLEEDVSIEPVMDETTDKVSGWSVDLSIRIPYLNCTYPSDV